MIRNYPGTASQVGETRILYGGHINESMECSFWGLLFMNGKVRGDGEIFRPSSMIPKLASGKSFTPFQKPRDRVHRRQNLG